ncbi:MAG: membrane protein insertase YidC [Caldisericaceae bacterium]|nr:membrane protein insertase YidC [Caldisericaceae bacterium]
MDRNSVIALILIAVIIILMPYYEKLVMPQKPFSSNEMVVDSTVTDTIAAIQKEQALESKEKEVKENDQEKIVQTEPEAIPKNVSYAQVEQASEEKVFTIENGNFEVQISNKGGGSLKAFYLKKFLKYDSTYVNFIDSSLNNNTFFAFLDHNGNIVDTKNFLFQTEGALSHKKLKKGEEYRINFFITYQGNKILKTLIFYGGQYHFDVQIAFDHPEAFMLNNEYQIGWENGLPLTEPNQRDDNGYYQAYVYMAEELENYKIKEAGEQKPLNLTGSSDWLAVRTKYFLVSIINENREANVINGVFIGGEGQKLGELVHGKYDLAFNARYNAKSGNVYRYYLGPLDYNILKEYHRDLDILVLNNGWYERTFRFFSLLILPILEFLHKFIPNYGLVIIVFSILIKLLLYPLTKKSYQSMREMQRIQPLMTELRAKYKDDPQRLNKEMMKLYKEHGVNPMGGCLPMLLQMPLLFALFIVFRSTIQLRGAPFIPGWINDLSRSEGLWHLPISLPFYGNEFNILPILMAITMIFQSKMTTQDPKQKAMIYIMPIFMLLIFNTLPSGLNLYYTMFNLLTIIQQIFINRGSKETEVAVATAGKSKGKKSKK